MYDFESIYKEYFTDVFRYARGLTMNEDLAEELTAETFFRAMRSLSSFRGECEIRVWLCQIAKNQWLNDCKKHARISGDAPPEDLPDSADLALEYADRETVMEVHRLLHSLDEPYKEVFSLRVFGEMSFRDIGDLFGKSEHWACVTYHRGKEKITRQLNERKGTDIK